MRLARVITRMNRGGPARTIVAIEPLLAALGLETRLFTGTPQPGEGDLTETARAAGIEVVTLKELGREPSVWADARALRRLRRELRAFSPDLVHTHTFKAGLLGRVAALGTDAARVHTFHGHVLRGYFSAPVSAALVRVERALARGTDQLIGVSEDTVRDLVEEFRIAPAERFCVVPGVVGKETGAALERVASPRLRVGCVARLAPIKAPQRFLELAHRVVRQVPAARFVWVGDGPLRTEFLEARARLGLESVVDWVGWQEDVGRWHRSFQVEVLLSDSEGMPVSVMEARAAGVPVVASRVGGLRDWIETGVDGALVEPGDVETAARWVVELLEDEARASRAGETGRRKDAGRFAPERHVQGLRAVYERALSVRAGRRRR